MNKLFTNSYSIAIKLFKILIFLTIMVSLYILMYKLYYKNYKLVHSWHFPMLLSIGI